jgi:hypothetical protein
MNVQLLIDAVVRQTTVLIAELATAGGARAPLSHVANQVFFDLAVELERQGVSRRVSADMFGIALRTYQRKIARLRESSTVSGRTLWEAVYDFLVERGVAKRADVLRRFERDDEELVAGVLRDLVDSGVVFASGRGAAMAYRVVSGNELETLSHDDDAGLDAWIWTLVYREGPISRAALLRRAALGDAAVDAALQRLEEAGRITGHGAGAERAWTSAELVLPANAAGWEGAVFDHFHAVVRTIVGRLRRDPAFESEPDLVGGSTYTFVVWPSHPDYANVTSELADFRRRRSELRARVDAYNAVHGIPKAHRRVTSYGGQCVTTEDDTKEDDE